MYKKSHTSLPIKGCFINYRSFENVFDLQNAWYFILYYAIITENGLMATELTGMQEMAIEASDDRFLGK